MMSNIAIVISPIKCNIRTLFISSATLRIFIARISRIKDNPMNTKNIILSGLHLLSTSVKIPK